MLGCAGYAAYEVAEQPTNQVFGAAVSAGPASQRVVALTFDDGPNPPYTDAILAVLEQEHVQATFFLVGRAVAAYPAIVQREARDNDALGNHSWDHAHLIVMTPATLKRSLQRTDAAIAAATGLHPRIMRPPFGARDWEVMQTARKSGYTVVMWSVPLARDWENPPPQVIAQRILGRVADGSIIVLHDGNQGRLCAKWNLAPSVCDRSADVDATREIVRALKKRGYRFVTIPQLMAMPARVKRRHALATR
ncbi:MAG: polysaccharide deacetylase family protein [Candidatus Baltobacteraceae bacterium]